jgi:serine/threonine-protein kinase
VRDVLRAPAESSDAVAAAPPAAAPTTVTAEADTVEPPVSRRRRRWPLLLVLLLLLGAIGAGAAWWFTRTISHEVPDLVGLEQGEALNMISEFDWDVVTSEEADDEVPAGVVIRTDPVSGTSLAEGSSLSLVVSTGPAPRVLPELAGLTVEAATAELDGLGLVLELGEQPFDEVVPAGDIIGWTVPDQPALVAGDTVLPGTSVVVSVSAGPAPRVVPDLSTLTVDQASAQLAALGLSVTVLPEEFSDTVPAGVIARQDPAAGTELERGATVSIVVSKGQDLVAVPPLADLTVDQVRAALEGAGLVLGEVRGDPAGITVQADVGGQTIGAGAVFPRGTAVDVTFQVPVPAEVPVEVAPTDVPPA